MIVYILYVIVCLIACYPMTKKSGMSYEWALFFSLSFSLLIAWIMVSYSGKKGGQVKYDHKATNEGNIKTYMCYAIGIFLLIYAFGHYPKQNISTYFGNTYFPDYVWEMKMQTFFACLITGIGFTGNGIYLSSDADIIYAQDEEIVELDND